MDMSLQRKLLSDRGDLLETIGPAYVLDSRRMFVPIASTALPSAARKAFDLSGDGRPAVRSRTAVRLNLPSQSTILLNRAWSDNAEAETPELSSTNGAIFQFNGDSYVAKLTTTIPTSADGERYVWRAVLYHSAKTAENLSKSDSEAPVGTIRLARISATEFRGTVQIENDQLAIEPLGDGFHSIVSFDPEKLPDDHSMQPASDPDVSPGADALPRLCMTSTDLCTTRLLVSEGPYSPGTTPQSRTLVRLGLVVLGDSVAQIKSSGSANSDVQATADDLVEGVNFALADVAQNLSVALIDVKVLETATSAQQNPYDLVEKLARGQSFFADIPSWREFHRLDVVGVITELSDACGQSCHVGADRETAYFVARLRECALLNKTVAHEIGHLFGARHSDQEPSKIKKCITPSSRAYGMEKPVCDIMSFCRPRQEFYSNSIPDPKTGKQRGSITNDAASFLKRSVPRFVGCFP